MIVTLTMTAVHSTARQFTGLDWTALHFQIDKYYIILTNILQLQEAFQKIISRLGTKWKYHLKNIYISRPFSIMQVPHSVYAMNYSLWLWLWLWLCWDWWFYWYQCYFPHRARDLLVPYAELFASPWSCKNFEVKCWSIISSFSRSTRISPT